MKPISWNKRIPFFKNTYILRILFLVYLTVITIMSIFFVFMFGLEGNWSDLGQFFLPMIGVYLLIFILFSVSAWIVMGNRYALDYTMDSSGILIQATNDKAKNIRKIAVLAGVLTKNPGVAGAGLMVKDNVIHIPWIKIDDLLFQYDKNRFVVKCSFWKQVAVHYPEDKLTQIENMISENYKKEADYV